jgi:hypothetical protein
MRLLGSILGVPATAEERENTFKALMGNQTGTAATAQFLMGAQHNTDKAGALLAAQGLFALAGSFALDHGWPKPIVLASMLLMFVGSLLVMSTLRGTIDEYRQTPEKTDPVRLMFNMLLWRTIRFNTALYLTFISILLLVVAALLSMT